MIASKEQEVTSFLALKAYSGKRDLGKTVPVHDGQEKSADTLLLCEGEET